MPESPWWWMFVFVAPAAYGFVMGRRHRGFERQPCLVLARDPAVFDIRLKDVGGPAAARKGTAVDVPFTFLLCGAFGVVLAAVGGPWWVAVPALVLDLVEGRTLWLIAGDPERTRRDVSRMFWIAVVKFVAYGVCVVALVRAGWQLR